MTVPIVPGPGEPEPQPVPQVVYVQAPQTSNPGRVASNTLVVLLVLVGVFCVLPFLCWAGVVIFGNLYGSK